MNIHIIEAGSEIRVPARIELATFEDMPIKSGAWKFDWQALFAHEGAIIYKLFLLDTTKKLQGLVMLSLLKDEMLYMNNIEVAPHNYGKDGQFDHVAGALIAYACRESFKLGKHV